MKLWNRIKYKLLKWLLDDICVSSEYERCCLGSEINIDGYVGCACGEEDVFIQARKAWGMEE